MVTLSVLLPPDGSAAAAATTGALPAAADATTACRCAGCRAGRRGCCCASAGCTVSETQANMTGSDRGPREQRSSRGERRGHGTSPGAPPPAAAHLRGAQLPGRLRRALQPGNGMERRLGPCRQGAQAQGGPGAALELHGRRFGLPDTPAVSSDWFRGDVYAQRRAGTVASERRLGAAAAGFRSGRPANDSWVDEQSTDGSMRRDPVTPVSARAMPSAALQQCVCRPLLASVRCTLDHLCPASQPPQASPQSARLEPPLCEPQCNATASGAACRDLGC